MFIPIHSTFALVGFAVIGLGCAPIYPCIIHMTPDVFGRDKSQAMIGVQMAFAYTGFLVMPPLWCGLAARLMMLADGIDEPPAFSRFLLSGKFILRSISAAFFVRLISALLLVPVVVFALIPGIRSVLGFDGGIEFHAPMYVSLRHSSQSGVS